MKDNNKKYIFIIVLLILIILGLISYIVIDKTDLIKKFSKDSTTTTTNQPISALFSKLINEAGSLKTLRENEIINHEYTDNTLSIKLLNNEAIYSYKSEDGNKDQTLENIRTVKYDSIDCMGRFTAVALTNDNEVWYLDYNPGDEAIPEFKKLNNKYEDVVSIITKTNTCGADVLYLLKKDNNYYKLSKEKFNDNIHLINNNIEILINGEIYVDNKIQNFSYKKAIFDSDGDDIKYVISSDDYLYQFNDNTSFDKYVESKIDNVDTDDSDSLIRIKFKNGEVLNFDNEYLGE